MKVKELIKSLLDQNQEAKLIVYDYRNGHYLDVVHGVKKATKKIPSKFEEKVVIVAES